MGLARRSVVIPVVLVVLAVLWLFRSGDPRAARPTTGHSIIAFGDSLVEGRGATPGNDFVAVLSRRLGVPIINAGRSGDTAGAALSRLDRAVLARSPRVVIVLLGGNDFLRRVPREETFGHLATIVGRIRERGAAVVLVGVSVGFLSDSVQVKSTKPSRGGPRPDSFPTSLMASSGTATGCLTPFTRTIRATR